MVRQFNSRNDPVKTKFAYLRTSGCCRLRNTLLVKLCTSWDDGVTAGNSLENRFPEYLAVTFSRCVGSQKGQKIFVPSGHFLILVRAKNRRGQIQVNKVYFTYILWFLGLNYIHQTYITYLLHGAESLLRSQLVLQASQEITRIFGTTSFLTVPTSARHLSLSWANSIQSPQLLRTSWRSSLILCSHLRLGLPNGLFPSRFPTRTLCTPLPSPYAPHAPPISFFSILPPAQYWVRSTDH